MNGCGDSIESKKRLEKMYSSTSPLKKVTFKKPLSLGSQPEEAPENLLFV